MRSFYILAGRQRAPLKSPLNSGNLQAPLFRSLQNHLFGLMHSARIESEFSPQGMMVTYGCGT